MVKTDTFYGDFHVNRNENISGMDREEETEKMVNGWFGDYSLRKNDEVVKHNKSFAHSSEIESK